MTDANSVKPEIKKVDALAPGFTGSNDPRFRGVKFDVPAKLVRNDAHGSNMDLQDLYSKGPLKFENVGAVCQSCLNFYPDPKIERTGMGRCKARGFLRVHRDTPAVDRVKGWVDPNSGIAVDFCPGCPL